MTATLAGTGPAGRRLLAAIDRVTTTTEPAVPLTYTGSGLWTLGGAARYKRGTIDRLVDAGLLSWHDDQAGRVHVALTAEGRTLLGA